MKKEKFSFKNIKDVLSRDEMKKIVAGSGSWCYSYDCACGSTSYNGWGNLNDYRGDARANCSSGVPVSCTFSSLPSGTCG
jgi:hypothetical protein